MANILYESSRGLEPIAPDDLLLRDRTLFLTEDVNSQSCAALIKNALLLDKDDPGAEITLCIHSNGGEVAAGLALYDVLKLLHAPVRTVCLGTAASMGAILFLAGARREMLPHARVMIHDPAYASGAIAGKKPGEIQAELEELQKTQRVADDIIARVTGKPLEDILAITAKDTWFTAKEAIDFGLATGITTNI